MFFNSQPNFYYPYKDGIKLSKNLFRRVRFRDNMNALYVASTKYTVQQGETPEQISNTRYGSPEWYWTILILNNIIDVNNDWPLADYELDVSIEKKYGDKQNDTRHWETNRIVVNQNVVLESGIIIEYFQNTEDQQDINYYPDFSLNDLTPSELMIKVTNREYEYALNEAKKEIFVIRPEYLTTMKEEIESLFAYDTEYKIDSAGVRFSE